MVGLIGILALSAVTGSGQNVKALFDEVSGSIGSLGSTGSASAAAPTPETAPDCSTINAGNANANIGTLCDFSGTDVIVAGLTLVGSSETQTPFFAARCDLGQTYSVSNARCECDVSTLTESGNNVTTDGSDPSNESCDATDGVNTWKDRSNIPWNDGTTGWTNTPLSNTTCSGGTCTDNNDDGAQAWNVAWDGQENAAALQSFDSATTGGTNPHLAVEACAALGSGWYLPALNELALMFDNRSAGEFANSYDEGDGTPTSDFPRSRYWSSSEANQFNGRGKDFTSGNVNFDTKNNGMSVRCAIR
ncbi:MAG: hypothetical protein Alpg2KO_20820 [Alphaproteobacteria bacterium]